MRFISLLIGYALTYPMPEYRALPPGPTIQNALYDPYIPEQNINPLESNAVIQTTYKIRNPKAVAKAYKNLNMISRSNLMVPQVSDVIKEKMMRRYEFYEPVPFDTTQGFVLPPDTFEIDSIYENVSAYPKISNIASKY